VVEKIHWNCHMCACTSHWVIVSVCLWV